MRKHISKGICLAALAGAAVMGVGPAAMAAGAPATQSPEGIALDSTGIVALGPLGESTSANPNGSDAGQAVGALLTVGALTSSVNGNTTTAAVASLGDTGIVSVLGPITAGAITTYCTANSDGTFTENTSVVNLNILGDDIGSITDVPADDTIAPSGLTGALVGVTGLSLELNQQEAGPVAGSDTVNGLVLSFTILGVTETLYLSSSTCGPYSANVASPVASGKGLGIGLGLLGLLGAGFGAVYVRRRGRALA